MTTQPGIVFHQHNLVFIHAVILAAPVTQVLERDRQTDRRHLCCSAFYATEDFEFNLF